MADSLFDNRYRYDYIYPRGRSGETLRAVDIQASDRPVVIKRPAPNDAPPIRAGQEVSILNERKALTRLAGHPVLTELLGTGQFSVGGMPHQYIVMERGQGQIVAEMVLELAAKGERMPELEMLVISDRLLDLLQTAHKHDIVYNDVDAKHLFWDRASYRLKLIDWGNAVFLEGDEITPQGVSRQNDVAQVGELLYMILTGGSRIDVPRNASDEFKADFGADSDRIHSRLQAIISRAVHPNLRIRYPSIAELRRELTDYRAPIMRERDTILGRVSERLRRERSRDELQGLLDMLQPALLMDPGYQPARELEAEIFSRLQDLEIAGDVDAVRIYMESGNWSRATHLLEELRPRSRGAAAMLINLLLDFATTLLESDIRPVPPAVMESIALIFEQHPERAAHVLVVAGGDDNPTHALLWLLAERISSHIPEILLLRPNLYRLDRALAQLENENVPVTEPRAVVAEINVRLRAMPSSNMVSLDELRDTYRAVVDGLTALNTLLGAVNTSRNLPNRRLPFTSLERALTAAMALADNMHVIGKQATSSPRDALEALDNSHLIDPNNESWDLVARLLNGLYELLGTYQTYVPAADGSDLEGWLKSTQDDLAPFIERLFDEFLVGMVDGLKIAEKAWENYANALIQGNRGAAVNTLTQATDAVGTISPTLAGWFNQLRSVISNAQYIERHALYGGLGRALADGWEAFDRGRLADAEQLGKRAYEIARTDPQRFTAQRLQKLAELTRNWVERNGINAPKSSKAVLVSVEHLFTVNENEIRQNFAQQMPSKETYLKAMSKGLVELYTRSSTAATRILFMNYVLLGALDAHEAELEDAHFWYEAAIKTLDNFGARHVAARTLDEFISRRRDILAAAQLLNQVNGPQALLTLENTIKELEANPQARSLSAGTLSLRELQAALRDWSDGEFRPGGIKLENAINAASEIEQAASISLTAYRTWLVDLQASAAELHTLARQMRQVIEAKPDHPDKQMLDTHRRQYGLTRSLFGEDYASTLRQWLETYEAFLAVYTDENMRRSARLTRFNELFRAMFIDRHPAYPLYRHWYDLTEQAPEFPAPPTSEPTPRIAEDEPISEADYRGSRYADDGLIEPDAPAVRRGVPRLALFGGLGVLVLLIVAALALSSGGGDTDPNLAGLALTITDTPTIDLTAVSETDQANLQTPQAEGSNAEETTPIAGAADFATPTPLLDEPTATPDIIPAAIEVTAAPTDTPAPTNTATATITSTPTNTATPTHTPTATLPPQGVQGRQDTLALLNRLDEASYPWDSEQFSGGPNADFWRLGIGAETPGETIFLTLPADLLETYYGNNAASRITRVEATLTLQSYNPPLLLDNEVYFGLLLQDATNPANTAGAQINLVQAGVINLAQRSGDTTRTVSQRAVGAVTARLRLDRDTTTGNITVFFNNEQIGAPVALNAAEAGMLPVLFVKDGGVIISVTEWSISLR